MAPEFFVSCLDSSGEASEMTDVWAYGMTILVRRFKVALAITQSNAHLPVGGIDQTSSLRRLPRDSGHRSLAK